MKLKKIRRIRNKPAINLTPLIDIVFIMLIFFAVNTYLNNNIIDISLPNAKNATNSDLNEQYVSITHDNNIYVNNNKIEQQNIVDELRKLNNNSKLIIKADKNSTYGIVVQVIDDAKTAGFAQFAISTEIN